MISSCDTLQHSRTHIVMIDTASGAKGVESLNQPVFLLRRQGARFIQGFHSVPPSGQWAQGVGQVAAVPVDDRHCAKNTWRG